LGVHISFVRSITMDAFKSFELARMAAGGNKPWRDFFDNHQINLNQGRSFDECTIQDRYEGEVGEEWKSRLSAKAEGRQWDAEEFRREQGEMKRKAAGRAAAGSVSGGSRAQTPLAGTPRAQSPALGPGNARKTQNEAYFARMGAENAGRPADLLPSQGGKYAGFGSEPMPQGGSSSRGGAGGGALPGVDEFQKDPVAALTKGFGWLSSTVGKGAKTGYEGWVRPGVQKVCGPPHALTLLQYSRDFDVVKTS